jgi:ABC-type sugar transport system ATPase subunit
MNFLPARASSTAKGLQVTLGAATMTLPARATFAAERPIELGVRPEDVRLANSGDGTLPGRVAVVEALGNTTFVHVHTEFGQVNVESDPALRLEAGVNVALSFEKDKVHVFDAEGATLPKL